MLPFSLSDFGRVFQKNDILSIDIGFTNIKVVHSRKRQGGQLKILNFGIGSTPAGCIKNGIISNMEEIAENLRKLISDNRISEKNVKIVISAGSNIISKVFFIRKASGKSIEEIIKEEVPRQMPVNILEQKLFYRITGDTVVNDIPSTRVLVTVVPNTMIDNYVRLMKCLNFRPVAIEVPFSSVARFFSKSIGVEQKRDEDPGLFQPDISEGTTAIIDLGSETTNLSVLNHGTLEFNRIILTGGRNLDEMIARKLEIDRGIAERYKKMHGVVSSGNIGDSIEEEVVACVREYMGEILKNVKRSLEFYTSRCGGENVSQVFFIGGGSGMKGLRYFSEDILGVPSYPIDMMKLKNIEFEPNLDRDKMRFLVNALGIAI